MRTLLRFLICTLVLAPAAFGQGGEIVPGDNLIVQGIPKIPANLAERVGRYS